MQASLFEPLDNTCTIPPQFDGIMNEKPKSVSVTTKAKKPIDVTAFVTEKQREIVKNHPMRGLFLGSGLKALAPEDQTLFPEPVNGNILKHLNYSTKLEDIATSFLTVMAESAYKQVDERFITNQTGAFQIIGSDGRIFDITFQYKPDYIQNPQRVAFPRHHLYFVSEGGNPITETGYLSHFFHYVPYDKVRSFEEFLLYVLRVDLELELPVIINGQTYTEPNFGDSGA